MSANAYDTISYEVDGHKATITLNRPDALNALSPAHDHRAARRLRRGRDRRRRLDAHRHRHRPRVLHRRRRRARSPRTAGSIYERPYLSTYDQWEAPQEGTPPFRTMTKPILAAVNGICCGAGLDWVTTGDIVIASDQAEFFDPHVSIGLVAGREMVRLARVLPRNVALRMALMGKHERMSAQRAYELGHDHRGRRARPPARAGPRDRRHRELATRRWRFGAPGWPSARRSTCRCTRPRSSPRRSASGSCAPRTRTKGPQAFVEKRAPELAVPMTRRASRPSCYDVDADDHVATITLNRPDALNAFDRTMCEEMRDAWRIVKLDDAVQRGGAAGGRRPGVLRRPRHQDALRPARRRLEPRGSRRAAQPEVAEGVEAGGVRGAGHVHRGRVLLRQRVRRRHLLATTPRSSTRTCSAGLVSALEPIGLMRRVGLGETLRIALMGNDERVGADTALRIGLVTEVVAARCGSGPARTRSRRRSRPSRRRRPRARCKAIWESLDQPYRAAMEQGLIYTRLGNPIGTGRAGRTRRRPAQAEPRIR